MKVCYIFGKRILQKFAKNKNYPKVRDNCHYTKKYIGPPHSISNLKFNVANKLSVVFQNGSNYDYHFLMKDSAKQVSGKISFWGNIFEKIQKNIKIFPFQ